MIAIIKKNGRSEIKMSFREIDVEHWNRRVTYEWFAAFSNPCYGVTVDMDVTEAVAFAKEKGFSFFGCMAYIVLQGMQTIEELRMRIREGVPVIYDRLLPSYTVMTEQGIFVNARQPMGESLAEFCTISREIIDNIKSGTEFVPDESYNPDDAWNEVYLTSVPWLSLADMSHPIPDDKSSQSVPRVCFDRWREEGGRKKLKLNITVSHALVDGYPLCRAFAAIQERLDRCWELYG